LGFAQINADLRGGKRRDKALELDQKAFVLDLSRGLCSIMDDGVDNLAMCWMRTWDLTMRLNVFKKRRTMRMENPENLGICFYVEELPEVQCVEMS
jgi:hypothetical protein